MTAVSSEPRRRYLAAWFPWLPADRRRWQLGRSHAPDETPLCFIEKQRNAPRVAAVNRTAAELRLAPGLTLADARVRVPHLVAVDMDRDADQSWLERIADCCDRYTPLVASAHADGIMLDITGCAHLFGGEIAMREDFLSRLSRIASTIHTSIAGTPQAARALARFGTGGIVPPGMDADAVAPLTVTAFETDPDTILALTRAGLKSVGDLAARPRAPLVARFGPELSLRLARILGEEDIGITPRRPWPVCSAERRFAEPIVRTEDALGTLERLALQTAQTLENREEGGKCFEAALFRTDGVVTRLSVETARPVRAPDTVLRLFRERIEALNDPLDPGYGYDLIRLAVTSSVPFPRAQHSLDGGEILDEDVCALVDRLSIRFGKDTVVRFAGVNTHIPERAVREVPAVQVWAADAGTWSAPAVDARPRRPIHLFRQPEPIEAVAEIPEGPPLLFRWRHVLHEITLAEGPERIAAEWWHSEEAQPTRDYYCVEDQKGRRFWVFRDGLYHETSRQPRWFLHGLFA